MMFLKKDLSFLTLRDIRFLEIAIYSIFCSLIFCFQGSALQPLFQSLIQIKDPFQFNVFRLQEKMKFEKINSIFY
jgi:hypothetical protein